MQHPRRRRVEPRSAALSRVWRLRPPKPPTHGDAARAVVRRMQHQADSKRRGAGMVKTPDLKKSPASLPALRVRHG